MRRFTLGYWLGLGLELGLVLVLVSNPTLPLHLTPNPNKSQIGHWTQPGILTHQQWRSTSRKGETAEVYNYLSQEKNRIFPEFRFISLIFFGNLQNHQWGETLRSSHFFTFYCWRPMPTPNIWTKSSKPKPTKPKSNVHWNSEHYEFPLTRSNSISSKKVSWASASYRLDNLKT